MDNEKMNKLIKEIDSLYTFVMDSYDVYAQARDYGNGEKMNMAEIHTLTLIADNPGITVSGVSKMWNRTMSAASQNINKLCKKDLLEKRKEKGNDKTIHLYVTDEGQQLSDMHKAYDEKELEITAKKLLEHHSLEELNSALNVIKTGIKILESNQKKD
ncbi:MAG: MarR family winged helix-turn-helix transcriptional regulator [Eubacterium sp.]